MKPKNLNDGKKISVRKPLILHAFSTHQWKKKISMRLYYLHLLHCVKKQFPKNWNLLETTTNRDISSFHVVSILWHQWFPSAGFPHLATANPTVPPKFPALETWEKHHKCFPRVSKPGNSQPDNSTSFPCIGNFGETYKEFLRVFTKVNSQTWGSHLDPLHGKLMDTYVTAVFSHASTMFSKRHFQSNYYF